jgi:hypothetical protein
VRAVLCSEGRTLSAFSALGLQPRELIEAVDAWADRRLLQLTPQALSMVLWSYARLGTFCSRNTLQVAAEAALRQVDGFNAVQLSRVSAHWASQHHVCLSVCLSVEGEHTRAGQHHVCLSVYGVVRLGQPAVCLQVCWDSGASHIS